MADDSALAYDSRPLTRQDHIWRFKILFATYVAYMGYYMVRKAFTICKTTIAKEFHWGLDATGQIWTAYLVAYMIGQFLNSFIGRKWGPRVILLGGLGISLTINAIFGFANSFPTFMVFMFFNGLVQASGWPGSVGGVARWLRPNERGSIMGIWSTSYTVGNIIVKGAGGLLLEQYGWRWSFWGLTMLTVIVWWLVYFFQRDSPEDVGLEPIVVHGEDEKKAVHGMDTEQVTFGEYLRLAANPYILMMGAGYLCIKFLRYALDSWLPAFLNVQGLDVAHAAWYSSIFDYTGLVGAIVAGFALDFVFRRNWALLCFVMGLGAILSYLAVIYLGTTPRMVAICFGAVGFMLYGPDTILCGAAAVEVAGELNGVAVAGLVNGIASFGPIVQEQVIAWLVRDDVQTGIRNTNRLALGMSIAFAIIMGIITLRLRHLDKQKRAA